MKKALAVLGLGSLVACSGVLSTTGVGSACTTTSDCNAGLVCEANVCAAGNLASSNGGGNGGGDSGGATTTSSGGSSGGSTGSTGSVPATGANFAIINGAPHFSASRAGSGVDVCVRATSDAAFTAALLGGAGVTYGNGSNFVSVTKVASTVRVIPAGGDCATDALFATDVTFDFSADGYYTGVVTGDTNGVAGLSIVQSDAPDAQTVNFSFVHALVGEGNISSLLNPLPYTTLNTNPIAFGESISGNVPPQTGQALKVVGNNGTQYFKNYTAITAGTLATIAIIGDVGQSGNLGPALVICLDGQGTDGMTATCTKIEKNAAALGYVRAANLVDTSDDAGKGAGMTICALPGVVNDASAAGATATWTLVGAEVGNFVPVDVGDTTVYFAASDCGTPFNLNTTVTLTAVADQYYSAAVGGSSTFGYAAHPTATMTQPTSVSGQAIVTTSSLALETAGTPYGGTDFAFLTRFGLDLGTLAFEDSQTTDIPASVLSSLTGATLVAEETGIPHTTSNMAFALPAGTASTVSVWFGGTGATTYALVCADDGSSVGNLSVCAAPAANTSSLKFGGDAFVRFANLTSNAQVLCLSPDATTWTVGATVAANSVGSFIGFADGTEHFGAVDASVSGPCATDPGKPTTLTNSALQAGGTYETVVSNGTTLDRTNPITPQFDLSQVGLELINEATDHPAITYGTGGSFALASADAGDSIDFKLVDFSTTLTVGTTTFTVPAVDGGAYTAITSGTTGAYALIWCDDYAGTCASVTGTN